MGIFPSQSVLNATKTSNAALLSSKKDLPVLFDDPFRKAFFNHLSSFSILLIPVLQTNTKSDVIVSDEPISVSSSVMDRRRTRQYGESCFEVSKEMTRLLRHDRTVLREEDGAVEFRISAPMFHSKFTTSPFWSIRTWLSCLQKGGGPKKRFQYCVDPYSADTI